MKRNRKQYNFKLRQGTIQPVRVVMCLSLMLGIGGPFQMSVAEANAREFRANARFCEELGNAARAGPDRDSWVQMNVKWLARAAKDGRMVASTPFI